MHITISSASLVLLTGLLLGCPSASEDEPSATETATDATATDNAQACMPGSALSCACSDGSTGTQTCAADGQSYDTCECAGSDSEATSSTSSTGPATETSTTTSPTGATAATTATTTGAESGSATVSSSGGESTDAGECVVGEPTECECGDGPGIARCNDQGELGECLCCAGTHPLVEGDLRYCEAGDCYCGSLEVRPPLDVCIQEQVAEFCCPVPVECY